jgi:hypothetical protein
MRKFIDTVVKSTPDATPPAGEPGEQLPMFEKSQRLQKKKSNNEPELTGSNVRDTKLSRALTTARGAYPTAGSDIEALVRQELDTGERVKQDVDAVQDANTAQDQILSQLEKVNQQQTAQIAGLEKQLSTAVQQLQTPVSAQPAPQAPATTPAPSTTKPVDVPIIANIPEPTTPRDQEIYDKVQSLEKELKDKIDAMASWNAVAQKDPQSNNELVDLRKEVARTRKELQTQINKLTKASKEPAMTKPTPRTRQARALPDPNVVDVDAFEIPNIETAQELEPVAREAIEKPTAIGQMAKNVGQGQELQKDPAYRSQVRRTQQQVAQRQQTIAQQKAGYGNDPDEFGDIPDINEGAMKEIDIMRQDLERMNDRQFYNAYGISKSAFQQKYRALLKPALDEHGGGIGPKQHWQDLMPEQFNPENDDWYDNEDQETELRSGDYVRDTMDGEYGEIFRMQGDPYERRVRILDRDGKGWYIEPSRLTRVDPTDPDVQRYFGKKRVRDMDEGWSDAMVARRTGTPRTPYSVYIKGKKWKDFESDDHAEAVANKLRAKFRAEGRDPSVITVAPTDITEGLMKEPTNRKEYLDQRDKLFRMMAVDSNPANKQIIKQALQDLEARYGHIKNSVKEDYNTGSEAVERAILNRIMVAHTDLLMKFGPEKVMQAVEEVAYNVGDIDEIGTSDVSAYVHQVKQILGVPEEVNEKWSQKYKSSINCASPKGFSQKAHCAGKKK